MAVFALDRFRRRASDSDTLTVGLVNNMPDAALKTTERQFRELIGQAAAGRDVTLRVFSFPELPRSSEGRRYAAEHHAPIGELHGTANSTG